jgi:hypothetical protein
VADIIDIPCATFLNADQLFAANDDEMRSPYQKASARTGLIIAATAPDGLASARRPPAARSPLMPCSG